MDYIWLLGLIAMLCFRSYYFATRPEHYFDDDSGVSYWVMSLILSVLWFIALFPYIAYSYGKKKNS